MTSGRSAGWAGSARAGAHEGPRHGPTAGAELLDADVLDGRVDDHPLVGAHLDGALEELGDDQGLVAALLEAAHVDQAGGDDLTALDRGDPGHRHEDASPPGHLDDQADDARPGAAQAEGDDDVADPADLVTERVEDAELGQAADEGAGRRAHADRLSGVRLPAPSPRGRGHARVLRRAPARPRQCQGRQPLVAVATGSTGAVPEPSP